MQNLADLTDAQIEAMSDAELDALLARSQPPARRVPQVGGGMTPDATAYADARAVPVEVAPLADLSTPTRDDRNAELEAAMRDLFTPEGAKGAMRAAQRGVPILGLLADEGRAAINALDPETRRRFVDPALAALPGVGVAGAPLLAQGLGVDGGGYADQLEGRNFSERYAEGVNIERGQDLAFDEAHPFASPALQLAGGVVSGGAMASGLTPATSLVEGMPLAVGATKAPLLARMGAGAVDGALIGAGHGYGMGEGGFDDPSRLKSAGETALVGGAFGVAAPVAMDVGGAAINGVRRGYDAVLKNKRVPTAVVPEAPAPAMQPMRREGRGVNTQPAVPTMRSAVRYDGKVYVGNDHIDAVAQIPDAAARKRAMLDGNNRGYVDGRGRFMNRSRAMDYARDNDLIDPRYARYAETAPELPSEWLKPDAAGMPAEATRQPMRRNGRGVTTSPGQPAATTSGRRVPSLQSRTENVRDNIAVIAAKPNVQVSPVDEEAAFDRIYRAAVRQGQTPEEAARIASDLGTWGMLADAGDETRALLRTAMNTPGQAKTMANRALDLRQEGAMQGGEYVVRPSSIRSAESAAENLGVAGRNLHAEDAALITGQQAASGPAYAKAYAHPPVPVQEFAAFGDELQNAYRAAQAISRREFVTLPDGTRGVQPLPDQMPSHLDWRTLDLMKQGLDGLVKHRPVEGIEATAQGALKQYRRHFVEKLDSLNPDYAPARAAFAGPQAMRDALEQGRAFLREDAEITARVMDEMGAGEVEMFRVGVARAILDKLGGVDVTRDAARVAGLLKPNDMAKLREVFPDAESFARYAKRLQDERAMFRTRTAAQGNSSTAEQLARMGEDDPLSKGLEAAMNVKTGGLPAALRAVSQLGSGAKMRESVADATAAVLVDMDSRAIPTVTAKLRAAAKRAADASATRKRVPVVGANLGGQVAARRRD